MSETKIITKRDEATGRFLTGRPKGARSKFSEAFISDLASIWEERGIEVLQRCASDEPATFLRVCASLMPQDLRLDVSVDATGFALKFRAAVEALGNEPPPLPRRSIKVINAR